jgi:hypothetical protein
LDYDDDEYALEPTPKKKKGAGADPDDSGASPMTTAASSKKRSSGASSDSSERRRKKMRSNKKERLEENRKAKAKSKGGKKMCSACRRQLPIENFKWDSGKCHRCKADLDAIYYTCKKQNQLEWLQEQKADSEKLTCLVTNYSDIMTKFKGGEAANKWSLMQYKEELASAASLVIADRWSLMTEDVWSMRSRSIAGIFQRIVFDYTS